jgi:hypothetical protein
MRISLADSYARGFNKWCAAHDPGCDNDGRTPADTVILASAIVYEAVISPPDRPHRPWLVPGAGTL